MEKSWHLAAMFSETSDPLVEGKYLEGRAGELTRADCAAAEELGAAPEHCDAAEELAGDLLRRIQRETAGRIQDLQVRFVSDGVVLSGRCRTYYTKQLAQHCVLRRLGEEHVYNQIEVV